MPPIPKLTTDGVNEDPNLGGALFSPFASIGVPAPQAAHPPPPTQQGDWGMPVTALVLGILCIGALIQKLVR
jgi:hypothetical protein